MGATAAALDVEEAGAAAVVKVVYGEDVANDDEEEDEVKTVELDVLELEEYSVVVE